MILSIEGDSPVPPFEQIRAQVSELARRGDLQAGTRLPTIRQLSKDLGLAGGTVARAYRELEAEGVIETRGRHGTFVAGGLAADPDPAALDEAARALAHSAVRLGVGRDRAVRALQDALADLEAGRQPS